MRKFGIGVSLLLCLAAHNSYAQKGASNWIDASVKQKATLRDALKKAGMPIESKWMKAKQKSEKIVANVKGQDKLVLITTGGPDGSDWDHAAWANAKLIASDGSTVWLDELTPIYTDAPHGTPKFNSNFSGKPVSIAGTKYDHSVLVHANGVVVFQLDKKFDRFESEVGIDDNSPIGSAFFRVQNIFGKDYADQLRNVYPQDLGVIGSSIDGGLDIWLTTVDASVEKQLVEGVINKLQDKAYFSKQLEAVNSVSNLDEQIKQYLQLFDQANQVLKIQDQLAWFNIESIELAYNDMKKAKGFDVAKNKPLFDEIIALNKKGFKGIYTGNAQAITDANRVLELKKTLLMSNPLLDVDKIIVGRYKIGANARNINTHELGTQPNNWSNQTSARRVGFDAEIAELSNLRGDVQTRTIFKPSTTGAVSDLKLHWDGSKIMFTSLTKDNRFNVFEVPVSGGEAKPLIETVEKDLEFFDATYLPSGKIWAVSNIGYHGVPCVSGSDAVGNAVLYDPKDKSIRRLTFDQDANWNPVVMQNGRVMYTRWEYTDLTHYFSRFVMHMNPDGTEVKALYGSGSYFPNSTFDMQPLPGHSSAFVGIISGHHGTVRSGRMMLFDPMKSRKEEKGMTQEIPFRNRPIEPIIKDELVDGVWPQFVKPWPLNDKYFLVSAKMSPESLWGIYLVDIFDNVTLVAEYEGEGLITPILAQERPAPAVIPDKVKLNDKESTVFIQDIYEGEGLRGVPRGTVKALRLFAYEYAYLHSRSDHNAHGVQSGWDIKRLLGVVPVEEDGSVIFKIPANTPISMQPLDSEGRAIQWMRSWVTGMPGEVVSCVGCHEDQNKIPIPKKVIASSKTPHTIQAPEGGVRSMTFDYQIQPILDRACVSCHNGENGSIDFTGGRKDEKTGYGLSYLNFHPYINRQGPEAEMYVLQPYEYHASTSELVRMLKKGHFNVKLTDKEWKDLYTWIDMNAPDKGEFITNILDGNIDQYTRRMELSEKYNGVKNDWRAELKSYGEYLKSKGAITPEKPELLKEKKSKEVKLKGWPMSADQAKALLSKEGETSKEIELAPGVVMKFVKVPAGQFVMGSPKGNADNKQMSKVKIDKPFWMAEVEVTNAQYNALVPEHDSRFVDQFWKDHTTPGYAANKPEQPVIRVSWEDAMAYCKMLSEKTGMNITLPTEAQWEWACRAGSDDDFWFGNSNSDFGAYDNMADSQLSKMAVSGVNPVPMSKNSYWYKYYNFIPKAESVDDGNMIMADAKAYKANPFGLFAMHGNVAEWTRSSYLDYPYNEKSKEASKHRVVRGGAWNERPKNSTSYIRKAYYAWQRVKNVGFRVIIED